MTDAGVTTRKTLTLEEALLEHHTYLKAFLGSHLRDKKTNLRRSNRSKDKLTRLSQLQLQDLSTDTYDELKRREKWSAKGSPRAHNLPKFLIPNSHYPPKRNVARKKSASLSLERFQQAAADVIHELERRYPHFMLEHRFPQSLRPPRSPAILEGDMERQGTHTRTHTSRGSERASPRLDTESHFTSSPRMMLLDLPPELLRQILHLLDPESFYICLLTCKRFREHAFISKSLLKDQLRRIPGLQDPKFKLDAASLVTLFSRRATRHLYSGGAIMSDVRSFRPTTKIDWKNSTLISCPTASKYRLTFAEVCAEDGIVRVYKITKGAPKLHHIIHPYGLSAGRVSGFAWDDCEVVKLAVCEPDTATPKGACDTIAVLYRSKSSKIGKTTYCGSEEPLLSPPDVMRLVTYRLEPDFGAIVTDWVEIEVDYGNDVVAVAVSKSGTSLVLTRWYDGRHPKHKLTKYSRRYDPEIPPTANSTMLEPEDHHLRYADESISSMQVRGKRIQLFQACLPVPQWTVSNILSRLEIHRRNNYLPDDIEAFNSASLGKAIAYHHHHLVTDPQVNNGDPTCINTALEVMLSREEHNTNVPRWVMPGRVGAFILKAIHYCHEGCYDFDLDKDYSSLHHVFVARLAGLGDLFNLSSLGVRMAVSAKSHRIAMASWKRVLVWAVDPKAFLDPETLPEGPVPGDYAYLEGCGYRYYQSNPLDQEMVELRPIELPQVGVVFELAFRKEDELWAWTDRGLVKWKFGVRASGQRDVTILE